MPQFVKHFVQDLTQDIKIRQCGTIVFNADDEANVITIDLYNGEEPATLTGSVVGAVICSDGSTVPVTGGTISGNTVTLTLTGDCGAVPGPIGVGVQIVNGTQKTTVLKAVYNVELFTTDNVVDPGSRITITVSDLVEDIETATAEIPASDMASLMAGIAPTFSTSTNYSAGAYVYYDGTLYKFTSAHSAGSWTGTDAAQVALANDVSALNTAVSGISNVFTYIQQDIDDLNTDVDDLKSAFAPEYDATKTYNAGNYVTNGNLLYRCFCDITMPESWADNHWMNVDAGSEMQALQRKEITYLRPGTDGTVPGAYVPDVTAVATGNRLVINGVAPESSTSIVIKAFGGWVKTSSNQGTTTTKRFQLIDGHTYQAELKYISGTATKNVHVRFANGNANGVAGTYTTNLNGDNIARCVYSKASYPDGISPNIFITRNNIGNTLTNYTVELTIRDVTDEAQIAPIENTIAMSNHAVDDVFWLDGILYKVTDAIASGESIVPGTNVSATTVMEELSALKALIANN